MGQAFSHFCTRYLTLYEQQMVLRKLPGLGGLAVLAVGIATAAAPSW